MLAEYAPRLLKTRMYSSFSEIWESCTKSWFAGMKFSLPFAIVCIAWMYFIAVLPPIVALMSALGLIDEAVILPAALCWIGQIVVLAMSCIRQRISPIYALTAPVGLALLYAMLLDSGLRIKTGKGVTWKGRRIYERTGVRPPDLSVR